MLESDRTSETLSLDSLLAVASGSTGRPSHEAAATPEDASFAKQETSDNDLLSLLLGGSSKPAADSTNEPPPSAKKQTAAAFDLAAAFGVAFDEETASHAAEQPRVARKAEPEQPFNLAHALGLGASEPQKDGSAAPSVREKPAPSAKETPAPQPAARTKPPVVQQKPPQPSRDEKPKQPAFTHPAAKQKPEPPAQPKQPATQAAPKLAMPTQPLLMAGKSAGAKETPDQKAAKQSTPAPAPEVKQPRAAEKGKGAAPAPKAPAQGLKETESSAAPRSTAAKPAASSAPASAAQGAEPKPAAQPPKQTLAPKSTAADASGASSPAPAAAVSSPDQPVNHAASEPSKEATRAADSPFGDLEDTDFVSKNAASSVPNAQPAPSPQGVDAVANEEKGAPAFRFRRVLMIVGLCLVLFAAGIGVIAVMVASGGGDALRNPDAPWSALTQMLASPAPSTVDYTYTVQQGDGVTGTVNETAYFDAKGFLVESSLVARFGEDAAAESFLNEAREVFGEALSKESLDGPTASFTVVAAGEPIDRDTYTQLLKRDTVDCQVVES